MQRAGELGVMRPGPAATRVDVADPPWIVAAGLFGLVLLVGIRQGGFWNPVASMAAMGSIVVLVAASVIGRVDRRSLELLVACVVLGVWWSIRAAMTGSLDQALPFGASCLAFAGSFAAVRSLRGRSRQVAGVGVACVGAAGSIVGFAGLIWRWFPMAMPAQGLWRLSTTLTYSDAAGLALAMCLLVALGVDRHPWLVRAAVCLCTGGLLATQSRGAWIAVLVAGAIVPWRRYVRFAVPLLSGVALGVAAIATSPNRGSVPWLGLALVVSVGVSVTPISVLQMRTRLLSPHLRVVAACIVVGTGMVIAAALRHEIGLRALAPSDHDRSLEWSAAWQQWRSASIFGVGPDRLLIFHTADGAYARFVHNEYLQVAADAGAIGLALLLVALLTVFRATRRHDVLSSSACAALVCCAVGGAFDYDWHLTFIGLLAGWCAGLAAADSGGPVPTGVAPPQYARVPVAATMTPTVDRNGRRRRAVAQRAGSGAAT